jgi:hypothetical protein
MTLQGAVCITREPLSRVKDAVRRKRQQQELAFEEVKGTRGRTLIEVLWNGRAPSMRRDPSLLKRSQDWNICRSQLCSLRVETVRTLP